MNKNAKAKNVLQGLPLNPCVAEKVGVRGTGTDFHYKRAEDDVPAEA